MSTEIRIRLRLLKKPDVKCDVTYSFGNYGVCIAGNRYYVYDLVSDEPDIDIKLASIEGKLLEMLISEEYTPEEIITNIEDKYRYIVERQYYGYGLLDPLLRDKDVIDIHVVLGQPAQIVHRKYGRLVSNIEFTLDELREIVLRMASNAGKVISEATPALSFIEPQHEARITVVYYSDITLRRGMTVDIRKQPAKPWTILKLIDLGTVSIDEAAFLWLMIKYKVPILIIGELMSGKSVYGGHHILYKLDGAIGLSTIEKLWDKLSKRGKVLRVNGIEYIDLTNIDFEILSLNGNKVSWVKPSKLIRHVHEGTLVEVVTASGRRIIVTEDHSLLVWHVYHDKAVLEPTKPSDSIVGSYVPLIREVPLDDTEHHSDNNIISSPLFGYLIGFLVAEGTYGGIVFEQNEGPILAHVLDVIRRLNISHSVARVSEKKIRVRIKEPWRHIIKSLGIGESSDKKRIPNLFWQSSRDWRAAFIAGLIDGDGYISPRKGQIEIVTKSRELAYGLLYALSTLGIYSFIKEKRLKRYPNNIYYRLFIPVTPNRERLKLVCNWLSSENAERIVEAEKVMSNCKKDVIPKDVLLALGRIVKRKKRNSLLSLELRDKYYSGTNACYHRVMSKVGETLYDVIPRNLGFDKIVGIRRIEVGKTYVYDFEVPGSQMFEVDMVLLHNTTFANAILNLVPPDARIMTIEDAPELRLHAPYWTRTTIRESEVNPITIFHMLKVSMRITADYIVVGEIRGEEAREWAQGILLGHGGISTFHAESPQAALLRLTNPPIQVNPQALRLLNIFVKMIPLRTAGRELIRRSEVYIYEDDELHLLFRYDPVEDKIKIVENIDPVGFKFLDRVSLAHGVSKEYLRKEYEVMKRIITEVYCEAKAKDPELEEPDYRELPRILYRKLREAMKNEVL